MLIYHLVIYATFISTVYPGEFGTGLTAQHLKFLQDKGYLEPPDPYAGTLKTQEEIKDSLIRFQSFAGIPVTGKIDSVTLKKFNQARCGMSDLSLHSKKRRKKRYVLQGGKWPKKEITYRIENYSPDLSKNRIHQTIRRALSRWEAASQLRFYERHKGKADIMIKFERKDHNDPYPFDGPGGTLAHAFYPGLHHLAGDTHFDEDELFTLKSTKGKNFYWVSLHEFGHAIGLKHNNIRGTVMYPWYERYTGEKVDLSADDKRGVQALYGSPNGERDTTDRPDSVKPKVRCVERVKAIFAGENSESIVVNNDKVYVYDQNLRYKKGPFPLSQYFSGLTGVDTAYKLQNGRTVFLHGSSYWEFRDRTLVHGPDHVSRIGLNRHTHNLDAAVRMYGKVYLFKGKRYWRLDPNRNRIDTGYPKQISEGWRGVPNHVDSVYQWNGRIFFFKGSKYYRLNERRFEVHQKYPLPILNNLLMCENPKMAQIQSDFYKSSASKRMLSKQITTFVFLWICSAITFL